MRTTNQYSGAAIILCLLAVKTSALPPALLNLSNSTDSALSVNNTITVRANSRQLTNSVVPNAGTGITAGSTMTNVGNSLNVLKQQLQANAGNNPISVASELEAQALETLQLQKLQNQQNILANVETQKQQVASAQAALTTPASTTGKPFSPGDPLYASVMKNPATQQTYAQLEAQKQKLILQQQLLQQAVRPDAYQQQSAQQILLNQLLNSGTSQASATSGQQIAHQQLPTQSTANILQMYQQQSPLLQGTRMGLGLNGLGTTAIYDNIYSPIANSAATINPLAAYLTALNPLYGSQLTQELLFQQQQQQQFLLLQQQQMMMSPFLYG